MLVNCSSSKTFRQSEIGNLVRWSLLLAPILIASIQINAQSPNFESNQILSRGLWQRPQRFLPPFKPVQNQLQPVNKPPNSAKFVNSNQYIPKPITGGVTKPPQQPSQPEQSLANDLDNVLNIPGVKCGTVPIFERALRRSINESFISDPGDEGGGFRILHGLNAVVGEWPWVVRLLSCQGSSCITCTGTLLNSRWIISAGHCAFNRNPPEYKYSAYFGLYDIVKPDKISFQTPIDKVILHPNYLNLDNDVALFKLANPVQFSEFIQPACFIHATRNTLAFTKNRKCYTVGYGMINDNVYAVKLQKLEIEARPPNSCNTDSLGGVHLRRGTVCIGPAKGRIGASCMGDSGGPDVCYDPKRNQWVIFGTVSYGPTTCDRQAGESWHTVSVDLSNHRTWILSTIKAHGA